MDSIWPRSTSRTLLISAPCLAATRSARCMKVHYYPPHIALISIFVHIGAEFMQRG